MIAIFASTSASDKCLFILKFAWPSFKVMKMDVDDLLLFYVLQGQQRKKGAFGFMRSFKDVRRICHFD